MLPEPAPEPKLRVLIVDDEPSIRRILKTKLAQSGFDPVEARDGEDAWEILPAVRPALVILDVMMPKLDGLALLRRIRESETWRALPVIMLTAVRESADKDGAYRLGAAAVLQKPFLIGEVLEAVKKHTAPRQPTT